MALLLALLGSTAIMADDELRLKVTTRSGAEHVYAATGLNITFSEGTMNITTAKETAQLALSDLDSMQFEGKSLSIKDIDDADITAPATVYSLDGRSLGSFSSLEAATSSLQPGIYVIVQGHKSFKLQLK